MSTYIALLRGINIMGKRSIKMAALRSSLRETGLENVQTYIQSGNVVFNHVDSPIEKLKDMITDRIEKDFGFDLPIWILNRHELIQAKQSHPFPRNQPEQLYFTFLSKSTNPTYIASLKEINFEPEGIQIQGRIAFLNFPEGRGRATLSNNLIERKLKVSATTRNWNTVSKVI